MIVADVMSSPARSVAPEESVKRALELLDGGNVTSLPVIAHGALVGVVSEADLIREALAPDIGHHLCRLPDEEPAVSLRVADVMSPHPITVRPDDDLAVVAELLTSTSIKSVPVVDERGRVRGMCSRRDIVRVLARPDEEIAAEIDGRLRLKGDWAVEVCDGVATVSGPRTNAERSLARATALTVPGVRSVMTRDS